MNADPLKGNFPDWHTDSGAAHATMAVFSDDGAANPTMAVSS